jgi:hypothetical protein
MSPDPIRERIARLEAGAITSGRELERVGGKLDEVSNKLASIELSMHRRGGIDRFPFGSPTQYA